jgi:COMPASS component SWD2
MKFSNDGKLMLLSTIKGHVYVMDAYNGRKMQGFTLEPNPDGGTLEASFSPDAQFVISGLFHVDCQSLLNVLHACLYT